MRKDAKDLDRGQCYQLMNGIISPRAIAWIGSVNTEGLVNLAPHSYVTVVSNDPPMLGFTSGSAKDTYRNIKATKEFVFNVVTEELTEAMNLTAVDFPPEISEVEELEIEQIPSDHVSVPRVKNSPLQLECKLVEIREYGVNPAYFIVGEVVAFHLDERVLVNDRIDPQLVKAVGRMGGFNYTRTTDSFEKRRLKYDEYMNRNK